MGDRAGAARGHPLPVACQRGLYLCLLQDLGGRVPLDGPKTPQLRQRNYRGGLSAEMNDLVRFTRIWITRRLGAHTVTVYPW